LQNNTHGSHRGFLFFGGGRERSFAQNKIDGGFDKFRPEKFPGAGYFLFK
jgi:hypothetical protein